MLREKGQVQISTVWSALEDDIACPANLGGRAIVCDCGSLSKNKGCCCTSRREFR